MHIDVSNENLTKLPDNLPQIVSSYFDCFGNQLTSLKGAPQHVGGTFSCTNNLLTLLEGAPQHVGKCFYCAGNKLTSLEGIPQSIGGDFYCDYYLLEDRENCYIIIESLIRGRFKKYSDVRLYSKCLDVLQRYL